MNSISNCYSKWVILYQWNMFVCVNTMADLLVQYAQVCSTPPCWPAFWSCREACSNKSCLYGSCIDVTSGSSSCVRLQCFLHFLKGLEVFRSTCTLKYLANAKLELRWAKHSGGGSVNLAQRLDEMTALVAAAASIAVSYCY